MKPKLSHLDDRGRARMVDVVAKALTERAAEAVAVARLSSQTFGILAARQRPQGETFATARVAAIQAAKRTPELIPVCPGLRLTPVELDFVLERRRCQVKITARTRACDRTGVEMEALVAASVAALTLYDMFKPVERGIVMGPVHLLKKRGGGRSPGATGCTLATRPSARACAARPQAPPAPHAGTGPRGSGS
jgi:cyclic pyranopterin phosphate synthase